jgi:hypothetical protein
MLKTLIATALAAATLSGCIVYPAHTAYYRPPVFVY